MAFYIFSGDDFVSYNDTIMDISNNYWGTNDSAGVNRTIRDIKTNPRNCIANYVPFFIQPNPDAPKIEFAISANATRGGVVLTNSNEYIDVPKNFTVTYSKSSPSFWIEANENYYLKSILVDGSPLNLTNNNHYSLNFDNVTADHSFFATFEYNSTSTPSPSPTPSSTNTQTPTLSPTNAPTQNPIATSTTNPSAYPSPTIPEFSSIIVLMVLVGLISLSVFTMRKRGKVVSNPFSI